MALLQIRLSETTIEEARKIGEKLFGNSTTDDKTFWTLVLEYQKSQAEKELLNTKLEKCTQKNKEEYEKVISRCISQLELYLESKTLYTDGLFKGAYQIALMVLPEEQRNELIESVGKILENGKKDEQEN